MNQENIAVKIAKQEEACEQRMLDGLDRLLAESGSAKNIDYRERYEYPYIERHSFYDVFAPDDRPIEDIVAERKAMGVPDFQTYEDAVNNPRLKSRA